MKTEKSQNRLITPALVWFLITMIMANFASRMAFVLLPVYINEQLGASVSQVGLVFFLANIVPLALQIFGGWLSDSIGRLPTIAIGAVMASFGYLAMISVPTWQWMIVALMLEFVSGSLVGPSFGAYIADQSSPENRAKVFGTIRSIYQIVGILGPPAGGFLASRYGYTVLLTTAASIYAFAAVLRVWMALSPRFKERTSQETRERLTLQNFRQSMGTMLAMIVSGGVLTWIFITDGIRDISYMLSDQLEPLYLAEVGSLTEQQIGFAFSTFNIAMALTLSPAGWLSARIGERKSVVLSYIVQFLGYAVFLVAGDFLTFMIAWFVLGIGFGLGGPAYDSLISKVVPEENRGIAYGMIWTSVSLLALPSPYLGGLLWEQLSPQAPFAITAVVVLLTAIPVWLKFRLPEEDSPEKSVLPASN
jgi:MFS family permease